MRILFPLASILRYFYGKADVYFGKIHVHVPSTAGYRNIVPVRTRVYFCIKKEEKSFQTSTAELNPPASTTCVTSIMIIHPDHSCIFVYTLFTRTYFSYIIPIFPIRRRCAFFSQSRLLFGSSCGRRYRSCIFPVYADRADSRFARSLL